MTIGYTQVLKKQSFPSTIILICGSLAAGIGFVALFGWLAGIPILTTLGSGRIPMASSTALLFVLYGIGVLLLFRPLSGRAAFRVGLVIGAAGAMAALLLLVMSSMNIHLQAEHLGLRIAGTLKGAPVGHMSPITAFCFVMVGLSFLASLSSSTGRTKPASVAFWSSVLVLLFSLVLLLAYFLGSPLLYGSSVIPPALPTALAFLFLGTALLVYSGQRIWPHSSLTDMADIRSTYVLLTIFLLLVAGIVASGYLYLRNYEKEYRSEVEEQLSSVARLKVSDLEQYRKERLGDASLLYNNDHFSDMVRRFFSNPDDAAGLRPVHGWLKKLQEHHQFDQVRLLDANGVTRLSVPAGLPPVSVAIAKRISDVMRTREIAFQDFHLNEYDHRPYLSFIVPILDTDGDNQAIGAVILRVDPETYLYPFISLWPSPSRTAETLLIRREGSDAVVLNELRFRKSTALKLRIPLEQKEVVSVQAALGRSGIVEGVDYDGVPVLADLRDVPDSPWVLIARMNVKDVYAPLRKQLWTIIALIGALLIGAGSGVALLWRQQHVRFYRERYEAAEELQKSEERYRILFNSMDEGFCVVEMLYGPDGEAVDYRFVEINPAFEKHTGLQQALGKTIRQMVPDHEAHWFEIYGKVARTGEAIRFENPARGLQRYYDVYAFRLGGEESRRVAILFNDITRRKQAEVELKEKEHLLSESQRLAHIGSFLYDKTGRLSWSEELYHVYGVSPDTFIPTEESFLSLIYPDDLSAMHAWMAACAAGEKQNALDFRINMPDGTLRFVRGWGDAVLDADNRLIYMAGMVQDITEQKQTEEALRESEEFNREVLNSMDFSVAVLDRDGNIIVINKAWERFALQNGGAPDKTGVGTNYLDTCRPDAPEALNGLQAVLNGELEHFELEYPCDSPEEKRWFVLRASPLSRQRGGIIVAHMDITGRKRMEEELEMHSQKLEIKIRERTMELEKKTIQAEAANRAKSEFLANMSHELRTPLNSIIGFSDILKDGMAGPMPDNQKDLLNDISTSGRQLLFLINDILDLSKVEAGQMELELTEFNLGELINGSLVMFKEKAMKHNMKVAAEVEAGIGNIIADERKIKQILFNLLSNAFKFTPDGGSVRVAARKIGSSEVRKQESEEARKHGRSEGGESLSETSALPRFRTDRDFIEISVTDTGIGIAPEDQKKLFQPFQQIDSVLSRKYSGTGLGLNLCKQFIELHGGRIWIESEVGRGSRFVFIVPVKQTIDNNPERQKKE